MRGLCMSSVQWKWFLDLKRTILGRLLPGEDVLKLQRLTAALFCTDMNEWLGETAIFVFVLGQFFFLLNWGKFPHKILVTGVLPAGGLKRILPCYIKERQSSHRVTHFSDLYHFFFFNLHWKNTRVSCLSPAIVIFLFLLLPTELHIL